MKRIISYIRKNGIKHTIDIIYQYKIDKIILKFIFPFFKNKSLKNIIIIESHNDFDCNGGAFYDYLIKNGYNRNYKIVWLIKHKLDRKLPENVVAVPLLKPSFKKNYYICVSKYFCADCMITSKVRSEQKSYFLTHGAGGLKSVKGRMSIPDSVDYVLIQSKNYSHIQAEQYSLNAPSDRMIYIGYPAHDILFNEDYSELKKITNNFYKKVIIWMPTFRKGGGYKRNDSLIEDRLGIPLIQEYADYKRLNCFLQENNVLLIIKIHPMQDLDTLKINDMTNITVLTGKKVKEMGIDNYRLIKCTDAMISDYSGIAFEYLQLNKPLAYVLSDKDSYVNGFVVDDIEKLMAGHKIYTYKDMLEFIKDVVDGNDIYYEGRVGLRNWYYNFHDSNNSFRLAEHMGLKLVD